MEDFSSLTVALERWFNCALRSMPSTLQSRVSQVFMLPWDDLTPDQRLSVAEQWDAQHDPALELERQRTWKLVCRKLDIENQIKHWELTAAPTASDLATKEARLAELRQEVARLTAQIRRAPQTSQPVRDGKHRKEYRAPDPGESYLAYPAALAELRQRLVATPEELAAWVFVGPNDGGLIAYTNANELDPPPRFSFLSAEPSPGDPKHNYLSPMMACWFRKSDIDSFQPKERYMTGADLIARWSKVPGVDARAYVVAKVHESRLNDLHPIFGGTAASSLEEADWPPLETGLFALSDVEAVESQDFGVGYSFARPGESGGERKVRLQRRIAAVKASGERAFLKIVAAEESLSVSRLKQIVDPGSGAASTAKTASWFPQGDHQDRPNSKKKKNQ